MADDIFDDYTKGVKNATKATKEGTDALQKLRRAQESPVDAENPDLAHIANFKGLVDDATQAQKHWTDEIKDSAKQLAEQAKQVGSLKSQFQDVTGALGSFMNKLKTTASVSNQYNLALREFRQGSESYTASLNLSTKAIEKHGTQSQKYMDAIQKSYNSAYKTAGKYGMQLEEVRKVSEGLQKTFSTQLGVMGNQGKALDKLRDQTVAFARLTGQDTSEAIQTMNERLRQTGMTLDQVRQEQLMVGKSIDDYKNKLHELGEEARKTGSITSKDFLDVLKQVRAEFRQGIFDAAAFSKSLTHIAIAGKKAGLTSEEAKQTAAGFGKIMQQAGQFSNFFGAKSAQAMEGMMGDMGNIQDQTLKKRLEFINRRAAETSMPMVQKLDMIANAMQGSAEGQAILMKTMRTHLPTEIMREEFKRMGGLNALQADMLTEQVRSGKLEKEAFELAKKSPEERAREAEKFASPMEKLALQGARAEKARHKGAKELNKAMLKITGFVEKYWYMFAAIQVGSQVAGGLLNRGLANRAAGRGLLGRGAPRPGSPSFIGPAAPKASLRQRMGARWSGMGGTRGVGGKMLKGGGAMFALSAAEMGVSEGIGDISKGRTGLGAAKIALAPGVGGYRMGEAMERGIGRGIYAGGDVGTKTFLKDDKSLTNYMGVKLTDWLGGTKDFNQRGWNMIKKESINLDWKAFNVAKEKYKLVTKEIKHLEDKEKSGKKLTELEKITLKLRKAEQAQLERNVKNIKKAAEAESEASVSKRFKKDQMRDILQASAGVDMSKITEKGGLRGELQKMVKSSGRLSRYGGAGSSFKELMSSPIMGAKLKAMAAKAGVSPEEMTSMFKEEAYGKGGKFIDPSKSGIKTPSAAPEGAMAKLRAASQNNMQITQGDSVGTETSVQNPDGGRTRTITTTSKMIIKQGGDDVRQNAATDALQVNRMKNNNKSR